MSDSDRRKIDLAQAALTLPADEVTAEMIEAYEALARHAEWCCTRTDGAHGYTDTSCCCLEGDD